MNDPPACFLFCLFCLDYFLCVRASLLYVNNQNTKYNTQTQAEELVEVRTAKETVTAPPAARSSRALTERVTSDREDRLSKNSISAMSDNGVLSSDDRSVASSRPVSRSSFTKPKDRLLAPEVRDDRSPLRDAFSPEEMKHLTMVEDRQSSVRSSLLGRSKVAGTSGITEDI
jgi:hypothetical protein